MWWTSTVRNSLVCAPSAPRRISRHPQTQPTFPPLSGSNRCPIYGASLAFPPFRPNLPRPLWDGPASGLRERKPPTPALPSPSPLLHAPSVSSSCSLSYLSAIAAITYLFSGTMSPTGALSFTCAPNLALFLVAHHTTSQTTRQRLRPAIASINHIIGSTSPVQAACPCSAAAPAMIPSHLFCQNLAQTAARLSAIASRCASNS